MTILSKPFYSKLLFGTIFCLIFLPIQVIAGDKIFNSSKKSNENGDTQMRSMHWDAPETKESAAPEQETVEEEKQEITNEEEDIWKKYKDLAAGTPTSDTPEDGDNIEIETTEEKTEPKAKKQSGLNSIIEDYKNAQKSKGKMNSRSFGSID